MSKSIYLISEIVWHHPEFARHSQGGIPLEAFRHFHAAEARCLELNRIFQVDQCPFEHPPREVLDRHSSAWIRWSEDETRLQVLADYVEDMGLAAPPEEERSRTGWIRWWREKRPAMEPWQWQAIWTFLDRLPHYRLSEILLRN